MKTLRVLELYSGIGGMHCALTESCLPFEVILAIDVNTTANKAYRHAFPASKLSECGIETLTVKQLDEWKIDMIVMSPPCQPFTRVGKKLDTEDLRSKSFLHLLSLLPKLTYCPSYILVENVKGFESSQTRDRLLDTLHTCSFNFQECLLTPLQFGIPNSRLRYYLIAKRAPLKFSFKTSEKILDTVPSFAARWLSYKVHKKCSSSRSAIGSEAGASTTSAVATDTTETCGTTMSPPIGTDITGTGGTTTSPPVGTDITGTSGTSTLPVATIATDTTVIDGTKTPSTNTPADSGIQIGINSNNKHTICSQKSSEKSNMCSNIHGEGGQEHTNFCTSLYEKNRVGYSGKYQALLEYGHNMRQLESDVRKLSEECVSLGHFLEQREQEHFDAYRLTDKELRRFIVMDIVHPCLTKTICFTKRYGHFMEGAGSIIQMTTDVEVVKRASEFKHSAMELQNRDEWGEEDIAIIRALQLRYFTPREIANLLCFQQGYSFPEDQSRIQSYRLLGNSLNVHVVSVLLRMLVDGDT
ncbi:tRNA (cytosine(38)-C(5))-methyltransferase-like isoform X1 [Mizuhopecten yessoensis]|uniref:tRNA (cytosine(38)-C(5))-methyltransferase-like isoform X1 n=2 Tax=Mizuhopecten yessoensis TaxID=6573 RepID=UPI000B457DE6|nr:tRNA (cytosine(38)-C(5))-methyltransferase-like isoform X1 [Mizuhopecten yessoensis]